MYGLVGDVGRSRERRTRSGLVNELPELCMCVLSELTASSDSAGAGRGHLPGRPPTGVQFLLHAESPEPRQERSLRTTGCGPKPLKNTRALLALALLDMVWLGEFVKGKC